MSDLSLNGARRIRLLLTKTRVTGVGITVVLATIFLATAEWDDAKVNVDAVAAAVPAWSMAQRGSLDLPTAAAVNPWISEYPTGTFSNRPPALSLLATPAYLALGQPNSFSTDPSTLTAAIIAAIAMGTAFLVLVKVVPSDYAAISALILAFGTSTWTIASTQLRPHAPGQLMAALGLIGLARSSYVAAGAALSAGILLRPVTAVFAAAIGVTKLIQDRRNGIMGFVSIAAMSSIGVGIVILGNWWLFREWSISGGYSDNFAQNLTGMSVPEYLSNLADMFILPPNGLFFWSPILLLALVAGWQHRTTAPRWSILGAIAAIAYLLIHARMNRASGGLPFNYRYPLEPIVMAAPFLVHGAYQWLQTSTWKSRAIIFTAALSVTLQVIFHVTWSCVPHTASELVCTLVRGS